MDTDYLPHSIILIVSTALFSYLSMMRLSRPDGLPGSDETPWFLSESLLFWLKITCLVAATPSGVALAQSVITSDWLAIGLMSVGLLFGFFVIDRITNRIAKRYPKMSHPWARATVGNEASTTDVGAQSGIGNTTSLTEDELEEPAITEDELTSLDDRDREMLRSIIRLDATTVREVMVPRLDMAAVEADSSLDSVAETMVSRGHSRLPVYEETVDKILGIIHARDVLSSLSASIMATSEDTLRTLVREAFIVPETKRVDDLLEEFQERRTQIAIVVDEYGGTEGLVTMEDVLEEIVGEIEDEFSRNRDAQIIHQNDGKVLVDAGITTEAVEDLLGRSIDTTEVDTVGGYVYQVLGRIPQAGDIVETDDLYIEVVSMMGRRLRKLRIHRIDSGITGATR
ncbi:MAG: hemolysin family protein [Chloroflexota bacterium]|nr:hemolysin family protein [Chloroflexota bacterium]